MKPLFDDLWIFTPEFPLEETVNDLMMHAFMLRHPRGNLLIGRVEHPLDHEVLADAGGVIRHYLTHWHEAAPGALALQQRPLLPQPLAGAGQPHYRARRHLLSMPTPTLAIFTCCRRRATAAISTTRRSVTATCSSSIP